MHIASPALTTTSYKKRKEKITKAKQAELESGWRERNVRLKEMGLPKESYEQYLEWVYGTGKKTSSEKSNRTKNKTPLKEAAYTETFLSMGLSRSDNSAGTVQDKDKVLAFQLARGPVAAKPSPTYTGSAMIGVATMHKSNMVPVFSDQEATDISKMRR